MKFHPGHYSSMLRGNDSHTAMDASVVPGVTQGFLKRYTWLSLEPALDKYDFSEVKADLDWCQASGHKLLLMIEYKTFGFSDNIPNPPYLIARTVVNSAGGYSICLWDPIVVARFKLLLTELGARFDKHPALEGVMTEETAPSIAAMDLTSPPPGKLYTPYTPELYRDAFIAIMDHAKRVLPSTRWFFFMNFIPKNNTGLYLDEVVKASANCVITGPDAEKTNAALQERTFWIYRTNKTTRPVMAHVSPQVYQSDQTKEEIYQFSTTDLGANYIAWTYTGAKSTSWLQAAEVMKKHPRFNKESW